MTDEEENKCLTEYKKLFCANCEADCTTSILDCNGYQFFFKGYEQGYEDCRHYAHDYYKPKWHDLRKDPNDLPTIENLHNFSKYVLCAVKFDDFVFYQVMSIHYPSKTWIVVDSDKNYSNKNVIAWCELTKFEE